MESSQVYWIVLCLLAFTQAVVLQTADSGVASDSDAVTDDNSPAVQYLRQLFQTFKESNRFRNGEMNLLPDETKGFATTVHCFQARNNNLPQAKEDKDEEESKRTLQFDFSSLGPSQNVLATQLVLQVPELNFNYVLSLYEEEQNGEVMGPLDSKLTRKGWLEFTIHYITEHTSHSPTKQTFTVSITDQSGTELPSDVDPGSLFDSITPLLVVYTYDNTSIRPLRGEHQEPNLKFPSAHGQKRELPLQDRERKECQRYSEFLTYAQIGWPGKYVINPPVGLHFTYCYGQCSTPYDRANKHSQLLAAVNSYHIRRNNPPPFPSPCCVPIDLTAMDVITAAPDEHITMECFEDVTRCGCV